jgi:hypothetical protein
VSELSFEDLRRANTRRMPDFDAAYPDGAGSMAHWTPLEWAGAACGEAGELANKCKKLRRGQPIPLNEIGDEVADVVIYLDLLC